MTNPAAHRLSVAPMMDWTDRHCRYFHRQFSRYALLYSEMITSAALVHGDPERLLAYHGAEHPVALQLGGSDPAQLAAAVQIAAPFAYDEINLNIGCPSDRVQSGCFGAVLMRQPDLVARCVAAMIEVAGDTPITVKCRIGVDDQIPADVLPDFIAKVSAAGVRHFIVHARKAWLDGLSPKENRDVPPLDYPLVSDMKNRFGDLEIVVNGGIADLDAATDFIEAGLDGAMIGRAAYHDPTSILGAADRRVFGVDCADVTAETAVKAMLPYIEAECSKGTRLNKVTRHMLGAFNGRPGARRWRQAISDHAHKAGNGPELIETAMSYVS